MIIDHDFVRFAHRVRIELDLQAQTPLRDGANYPPGHAADLGQGRTNFERHADAVAGVGRETVKGPAFLARAIEKCLAHAGVVFVTPAGDQHGAASVIHNGLAIAHRGHASDFPSALVRKAVADVS